MGKIKIDLTRTVRIGYTVTVALIEPFNRTSLELKLVWVGLLVVGYITFNRTSLELKHRQLGRFINKMPAFNRTSLELKLFLDFETFAEGCGLLIEPVWN